MATIDELFIKSETAKLTPNELWQISERFHRTDTFCSTWQDGAQWMQVRSAPRGLYDQVSKYHDSLITKSEQYDEKIAVLVEDLAKYRKVLSAIWKYAIQYDKDIIIAGLAKYKEELDLNV